MPAPPMRDLGRRRTTHSAHDWRAQPPPGLISSMTPVVCASNPWSSPPPDPVACEAAAFVHQPSSNAEAESNQGTEHLMDKNNSCSLCRMGELRFETPLNYCGSCSKKISPKGVYYCMRSDDTAGNESLAGSYVCSNCYKRTRETIKLGGISIQKAKLEKMRGFAEANSTDEPWVECGKCKAWQHQICALFNGKRNEAEQTEHTCPDCLLEELENGVHNPLSQRTALAAKNLPKSMLSDHIEQWVLRSLKEERQERANKLGKNFDEVPGVEDLVVRVVSSVDKKLQVEQQFFELVKKENYPPEFPYKSKAILLFQTIEGADVCLFGMYVQEYGSECPLPNQRHVCISYIDSVKYFRPEIKAATGEALRTFVYHEILLGYLDYCKKRGFTRCYIWSCPSMKQDDYIIYCHPKTQKIPKPSQLRRWYQTLISKAMKENIIVEHTNLYDHFIKLSRDCKARVTAACLPYFDGDYWPGEAEVVLQQRDDNVHQKNRKKAVNERTQRAAARRADLSGN